MPVDHRYRCKVMGPRSESESFERLRGVLATATDINAIRFAMNSYLHMVGSTMSSYYHYPPIGASDFGPEIQVYTHGFPTEWVELYRSRNYLQTDPMPKVAATQTRPFLWSDIEKLAALSDAERKYLAEARKAGFGNGLAVPVFGPHGRNGYFAIGFGPAGVIPPDAVISEIHWACQAVHLKFCDLILRTLPGAVTLSDRESQILGFVVRGLSNQMIASRLNISSNTVDTYVRRCFGKLEVNDRVTAGLRGLALGLVA